MIKTTLNCPNMYKIDKIDFQIVNLLMQDGRMSCADMARLIGDTSERAVRYRIERLVQEKVIQITAIVNPASLGYSVIADILVEVEPGSIQEVAQRLVHYECISYLSCSIGEKDISIQIVAKNNKEVYSFVTEVVGKVPGVRKTTTSIVPMILKDVYNWHIPISDVEKEKS